MSNTTLDPVRLARVRALAQKAAKALERNEDLTWTRASFDGWVKPLGDYAAACDPAFLLSLIEAAEDTKRLEWLAESATSISDGYGPDGISMDPAKATHGRVLILQTHLPTVPRETEDWFRAAIDAAIAESNA